MLSTPQEAQNLIVIDHDGVNIDTQSRDFRAVAEIADRIGFIDTALALGEYALVRGDLERQPEDRDDWRRSARQIIAAANEAPEPLNLSKDELHRIADRMQAPMESGWAHRLGAFLHDVASYADTAIFAANVEANRGFIERYRRPAPLDAQVTADVRAGINPLANMPKPSAIQALLANAEAEEPELLTAIRAWFGSFDAPHHVKLNEPLELGVAAFGAAPVTIAGLNASGLVPADENDEVRYYETLNRAGLRWVLQQLENEND